MANSDLAREDGPVCVGLEGRYGRATKPSQHGLHPVRGLEQRVQEEYAEQKGFAAEALQYAMH